MSISLLILWHTVYVQLSHSHFHATFKTLRTFQLGTSPFCFKNKFHSRYLLLKRLRISWCTRCLFEDWDVDDKSERVEWDESFCDFSYITLFDVCDVTKWRSDLTKRGRDFFRNFFLYQFNDNVHIRQRLASVNCFLRGIIQLKSHAWDDWLGDWLSSLPALNHDKSFLSVKARDICSLQ